MWATAASDTADTCVGIDPYLCLDALTNNWVSSLLGALALFILAPLGVWTRRRWGRGGEAEPLTPLQRNQLLAAVRSRSWGQLDEIVGAPEGYLDLDLVPQVGLVKGNRSASLAQRTVPNGRTIVERFESSRRRVLLVGEPGSGKTVLAYKIAEHLDRRYQADPKQPIPLVLNLTTWRDGASIRSWVVDQLCDPYQGLGLSDRRVAELLVDESKRLGFIFDGLDEVPNGHRVACVEALDAFVQWLDPADIGGEGPPATPVVVTCRCAEYEQLLAATERPLGLEAAFEARELDPGTVVRNLMVLADGDAERRGDEEWRTLRSEILARGDTAIGKALASPLILGLVVRRLFRSAVKQPPD
jgi:GTPase SAR1 family protein